MYSNVKYHFDYLYFTTLLALEALNEFKTTNIYDNNDTNVIIYNNKYEFTFSLFFTPGANQFEQQLYAMLLSEGKKKRHE